MTLPDFASGGLGPQLRALVDCVRSMSIRTSPGSGIAIQYTPSGAVVSRIARDSFWARLTSKGAGTGQYNWVRLLERTPTPANPSLWADHAQTGVATEANGTTGLPVGPAGTGVVVRLSIGSNGVWSFQKGLCYTTASGSSSSSSSSTSST